MFLFLTYHPPHICANTTTGGLITASTLALLGLVVLPYRRRAQRADFRRRVGELRTQMDQALAVRWGVEWLN